MKKWTYIFTLENYVCSSVFSISLQTSLSNQSPKKETIHPEALPFPIIPHNQFCCLVAQSCPTNSLWPPRAIAHQTPLVHGILQARILEQVAIPFFRGPSQPRNCIRISYIAGGFFTTELPGKSTLITESENESHSVVSDSLQPHDSVHGILQARILEWVAFLFSRGSSQPRDRI